MTTTKNAPGADGTAPEGMTPEEGIEMTSTMVAQTADIYESSAQLRDEWLRTYAAKVSAIMPAWADPELTWVDIVTGVALEDVDAIEFRRTIGSVTVGQLCYIDDGEFTLHGMPDVQLPLGFGESVSVSTAMSLGADLVAAAQCAYGHPEMINITVLAAVAEALGVSPGKLLQLKEAAR